MVMSIVCAARSRWWEGVVGTMLTSGNGSMMLACWDRGNEMRKMDPRRAVELATKHAVTSEE